MIKAVFFDYGGVLSQGGTPQQLAQNLADKLNISWSEADNLLTTHFEDVTSGRDSMDNFWGKIEHTHGKPITSKQRAIWTTVEQMIPLPEMLTFRDELNRRGVATGIISNVDSSMASQLAQAGYYDNFTPLVLSSTIGYKKPHKEIFTIALNMARCMPHEAIFVDDQERMLTIPRAMGVRCIHANNTPQIMRDVEHILSQ